MGLINLYKKAKLNKLIGKAVDNPELLKTTKWWTEFTKALSGVREIRVMVEQLKGYKTYIVAGAAALLTVMKMLGYMDEDTYNHLLALLMSGGVATVAAKINRVTKRVEDVETEMVSESMSNKSHSHTKKLILFLLIIPFSSLLYAQTFPLNAVIAWNPNPATEEVTSYNVSINGGLPTSVSPSTRCTATECTFPFVITGEGPLSVTVTATNTWGTSDPSTIKVEVRRPGQSTNIQIRPVK